MHLCHVPLAQYPILQAQVIDMLVGPVVFESLHPGYKAWLSLKPLTGESARSLNERVALGELLVEWVLGLMSSDFSVGALRRMTRFQEL